MKGLINLLKRIDCELVGLGFGAAWSIVMIFAGTPILSTHFSPITLTIGAMFTFVFSAALVVCLLEKREVRLLRKGWRATSNPHREFAHLMADNEMDWFSEVADDVLSLNDQPRMPSRWSEWDD